MSLSLLFVQLIGKILQKLGRGGSFPGILALKLDPHMIEKFILPKKVILVTGTNGKTTTANLLADCLRNTGLNVVNNKKGDNLNVGIASLLALNSDLNYHIKADACVIEVDELTLYRQFYKLKPSHLIINNFFRDQLDRVGEMETIIRRIEEVCHDFTGTLVLNADDPNVLRIQKKATKAKILLYSVAKNEISMQQSKEASEGKFCPYCGNRLEYDYYQYSHIGRFHCPYDNFGTIEPTVLVKDISYCDQTFKVDKYQFHSFMNTIYAIYNSAAVITVLKDLNLDLAKANDVFKHFSLKEGRNESFKLKQEFIINLVKNPTGTNEVLKYIINDQEKKNILLILNDNDQDGHDISWIWDAHFEYLKKGNVNSIVTSGLRAYDMALRLKYEGLAKQVIVEENIAKAIDILNKQDQKTYVLSTYTALHGTRNLLRKRVKL